MVAAEGCVKFPRIHCVLLVSALLGYSCTGKSPLPDQGDYYLFEDAAANLTADSAWSLFEAGAFARQSGNSFNPGFTHSQFWLVVSIDKIPAEPLELEIGTAQINEIDFYPIRSGKPTLRFSTGDSHVYSSRPTASLNFNFPLEANVPSLLRIDKRNESLQLTFQVRPAAVLHREAISVTAINGVLTGTIALMLIFGFYLFAMTREKVYLFYILYVTCGWLYVLANVGYGYKFLWPDSPWFAERARPVFALITIGLSLFFIEFYTGEAAYRWLRMFMRNLAYGACLMALVALTPGVDIKTSTAGYYFQALIPGLVAAYILSLLITLVQKIRGGNRMALFYLLSIAPIALFSILQVFYYSGGVDFSDSWLQDYGQATGYVLEAVILTFGLAYRFDSYRREKEQLLVSLNQQQARYAKTIISTQETERRQLADQLHDVAGSLLSAAKLNLSSVREKNLVPDAGAKLKLTHAEDAVTEIAQMLRNLSHAISPIMLEKIGFRQSVEKVAAIFNSSGKISVELEVVGFETEQPEMNEKFAILYGILYELINNVVKHAHATHALVQLIDHDESVVMIVEDNGKGLAQNNGLPATHGLDAIRSKIHYLDGTVEFDNGEKHGLIVTIEIPKKK